MKKNMINDVIIKKLKKNRDDRGWLSEVYRNDEIDYSPSMAYASVTNPGVVRGPHEHVEQSDFFVFFGPGNFRLYLWDNRDGSSTNGEHLSIVVGEDNPVYVMVPPGVVHGYKCISDASALSLNLPDKLYAGSGKNSEVDEIRWENEKNSPFIID